MYLLQFHFSLCFPPLKQTNDVKKKIAGLFMILGQVFFSGLLHGGRKDEGYIYNAEVCFTHCTVFGNVPYPCT